MDWQKEFQNRLAGWESAADLTLRREYCLSKLRVAAEMEVDGILHKVVEGSLPLYALNTEDFPILFELLSRLFKIEVSLHSSGVLIRAVKDMLASTILNLISRADVSVLESFVSAAKAYSIPAECVQVRLNWRADVTPAVVTFFEEHREDLNFEIAPCYFDGMCWKGLGWPDFLRSLKLLNRKDIERAIVLAGEEDKDSNSVPYEWNLGSLALLIVTEKVGDDILSLNYRDLALAKWITYKVGINEITDSVRAWMKDAGIDHISRVFNSAMLVAAEMDKKHLRRGLREITWSIFGVLSHSELEEAI